MENIEDILFKSRELFFHFVDECNNRYRNEKDLEYYRNIIEIHRRLNNIEDILKSEGFLDLLRNTLVEWDMNKRAAELQEIDIIKKNILSHESILKELYKYKLHEIFSLADEEGKIILNKLNFIFKHLNISKTKRQLVSISKTLHFLLPDLVLPMDGRYTMSFYRYSNIPENLDGQFNIFKDVFIKSHHITKKLILSTNDLDNVMWNTSVPKLIDDAIIGFSKEFEEFVDNDNDRGIINFLDSLSKYTKFSSYYLRDYLEERRDKFVNSERQKIKKRIIIIKAKEAGITVSDEEIDNYLKNKQ